MFSTSSATDRLIFTLIGSAILHLIVILGVSFNIFSPPTNAPVNQLDITLVKQQTEQAPETPSYLAQVNNEEGGETDEKSPQPNVEPPIPITSDSASPPPYPSTTAEVEPLLIEQPVLASPPLAAPAPPRAQSRPEEAEPTPQPVKTENVDTPPPVESSLETKSASKKITAQTAERQVETAEQETVEPVEEPATELDASPTVSGAELVARARSEIGSLENLMNNNHKALSQKPTKRRISAATKEYQAAAYMRSWEMKVERIGNMNYPQEAKDKGINGSLMLSVDIKPDGSVPPDGIVVSRSSGHKLLDDAAVRIVRLGAPYAAIPEEVLKGSDMLTIIRTWKFESARGLSTR